MLCVLIFNISGETYSLKSTLNDRFLFEKLFMAALIYSQSSGQKSAVKRIAEEILFFFVFCFDVWPGARILALRLISQHITY